MTLHRQARPGIILEKADVSIRPGGEVVLHMDDASTIYFAFKHALALATSPIAATALGREPLSKSAAAFVLRQALSTLMALAQGSEVDASFEAELAEIEREARGLPASTFS